MTEPVNYHLFGSVALTDVVGAGAGFGLANAQIRLLRGATVLHDYKLSLYNSAATPFNVSGTLQPGLYILEGQSGAVGTSTGLNALWASAATYDGRIDFSPVPSPGPAAILVAGIAVLGRLRRCRPM